MGQICFLSPVMNMTRLSNDSAQTRGKRLLTNVSEYLYSSPFNPTMLGYSLDIISSDEPDPKHWPTLRGLYWAGVLGLFYLGRKRALLGAGVVVLALPKIMNRLLEKSGQIQEILSTINKIKDNPEGCEKAYLALCDLYLLQDRPDLAEDLELHFTNNSLIPKLSYLEKLAKYYHSVKNENEADAKFEKLRDLFDPENHSLKALVNSPLSSGFVRTLASYGLCDGNSTFLASLTEKFDGTWKDHVLVVWTKEKKKKTLSSHINDPFLKIEAYVALYPDATVTDIESYIINSISGNEKQEAYMLVAELLKDKSAVERALKIKTNICNNIDFIRLLKLHELAIEYDLEEQSPIEQCFQIINVIDFYRNYFIEREEFRIKAGSDVEKEKKLVQKLLEQIELPDSYFRAAVAHACVPLKCEQFKEKKFSKAKKRYDMIISELGQRFPNNRLAFRDEFFCCLVETFSKDGDRKRALDFMSLIQGPALRALAQITYLKHLLEENE